MKREEKSNAIRLGLKRVKEKRQEINKKSEKDKVRKIKKDSLTNRIRLNRIKDKGKEQK